MRRYAFGGQRNKPDRLLYLGIIGNDLRPVLFSANQYFGNN